MLTTRIIPCLDVRDGRVVKGVRFSGLRDAGCPIELAREYERQGADEIVLLDVSATHEGRAAQGETIAAIRRQLSIPLTVGGGIRSVADARCLLEAGADKVSVNSAAALRPELIEELAAQFGSQCTVVAIDAARAAGKNTWQVLIRSGSESIERDAISWAKEAVVRGAGEILLTSWDRDGTRDGYDLDLLEAVGAAVEVPVIASGGAEGAEHMCAAINAGASAVLAASIFHDGDSTVGSLKTELSNSGIAVRLC